MATLRVSDLSLSSDLDRRALKQIYGGAMSFGWIRPYTEQRASSPYGLYIGQVNVYNLIDPVFNTVNQVEYTKVDISEVANSVISNSIGQAQNGLAG